MFLLVEAKRHSQHVNEAIGMAIRTLQTLEKRILSCSVEFTLFSCVKVRLLCADYYLCSCVSIVPEVTGSSDGFVTE